MFRTSLASKLALAATAALIAAAPLSAAPRMSGEEKLNRALAGRVAGQPVSCIDPRQHRDTQIIDRTAIIYGSGRTIYVQRPQGAQTLHSNDILVTKLTGSGHLCDVDTIRLLDQGGGWYRGFVGLNKFVPYTRVAGR